LSEFTIPYRRKSDKILLTGIGDLHIGNVGFDEKYFLKTRKWILQNNVYVILMGDLMDCIDATDKRFELSSLDPRFRDRLGDLQDACYEYLLSLLTPIKDNIIGVVTGNHEDKLKKKFQTDITKRLANDLGKKYLGYTGLMMLTFRRGKFSRVFRLWYHHGHGGSRTTGGKLNNIERKRQDWDADLYMMNHVHGIATSRKVRLTIDKHKNGELYIKEKPQAFIINGSFMRTYTIGHSGYGEKAGYPIEKMGCATFQITPETGDIHVIE